MILAHGIGGRVDLPVPLPVLIAGAGFVLVISFVALAFLWPAPRLQSLARRSTGLRTPPRAVGQALALIGLFAVVAQIVPDVVGLNRDVTRPSLAPVLVFVAFWLVIPFVGALLGNVYTYLNPWRALGTILSIGSTERPALLARFGVWPATLSFLAFAWLELIHPDQGDPLVLATASLLYTIAMVVVMSWAGRETGLSMADAFTPYNRLISSISPIGRSPDGRAMWRGWLRALPAIPEWPGLWVFVVVMIATVSFDGMSGSTWFQDATGSLMRTGWGQTLLLIVSVNLIAIAYLGVCAAAAGLAGSQRPAWQVAQRFAHTLVPIALAYAVAHYFTLILFEGQQLMAAVSDPFGLGWDLFGTADWRVNFFITTSTPIWLAQVGFIVGGHVLGVILAHDRSLEDFGRRGVRSQYAMLVLMIALTSLGLVILSG